MHTKTVIVMPCARLNLIHSITFKFVWFRWVVVIIYKLLLLLSNSHACIYIYVCMCVVVSDKHKLDSNEISLLTIKIWSLDRKHCFSRDNLLQLNIKINEVRAVSLFTFHKNVSVIKLANFLAINSFYLSYFELYIQCTRKSFCITVILLHPYSIFLYKLLLFAISNFYILMLYHHSVIVWKKTFTHNK